MGAGRKKKTLNLKEKPQPHWSVNCSASARNLRKSDLGAVIFGCKNNTIKECYCKQLFGLPAPHFAYVKNISPGLVLFLFNYSDRKLHGIFEAASPGQMNINPYGWTADATEYTPYAAQVQVRIRNQCLPVTEDIFGPVIAENYYQERLFWFELDWAQTNKLISLFSSSPAANGNACSRNTARWTTLFHTLPTPDTRQIDDDSKNWVSEGVFNHPDQTKLQWSSLDAPASCSGTSLSEASTVVEAMVGNPKPNCQLSYASVVSKRSTSLPQKSSYCDTIWEEENIRTEAANLALPPSDQSNTEEFSCVALCPERESSHPVEACGNESVAGIYDGEFVEAGDSDWTQTSTSLPQRKWSALFKNSSDCDTIWEEENIRTEASNFTLPPYHSNTEESSCVALCPERESSYPLEACGNESVAGIYDGEFVEAGDSDWNLPHSAESNMEWGSSSEACTDDDDANEINDEETEELVHQKPNCEQSEETHNKDTYHSFSTADVHLEEICHSVAQMVTEMKSSDLQPVVIKLIQEIEGLKGSQLKQLMKISSLEQELVESKVEIQQLKKLCDVFESGSFSPTGHVEVEYEPVNGPHTKIDESILIVGGFDGSSWLSALGSYSPSRDIMKSLSPMPFVRSYASAAKLNGELYIFGGVDGDLWYDTVESYNPTSNQWVSRPSLNQKKGSLAGTSVYDNIFAVGGGNGVECFSEVEMFDPNIGRWISTQSMQYKRFAPAAAEINGTVYVVGGYDGRNYLKSVERFDPREHSWNGLGSMSTSRGCHSLVVLNEKLYALGGYDGSRMVSTVEVFDPRIGSWMIGEPMNEPRGYSGAFVIGENIYIIGGLNDSEEILETIEFYKEGCGWEVTNLKAVGKRCFFSAHVL